ncbi:MAG: VOC family protein [Gemmatimonadaceae bacterium]
MAGQVVWHELRTTDTARAREFYAALFGWAVQPPWAHPDDPAVLHLHGSDVATVTSLGRADGEDSHWLPFIAVADVDACCSRVPELRGSVYQSAEECCGAASMAVLEDPQGAVWAALASGDAAAGARLPGMRAAGYRFAPHRPTVYRPTVYRPTGFQPTDHEPVGYRPAGYRPAGYVGRAPGAVAGSLPSTSPRSPAHESPSYQPPGPAARPGAMGRTLLLTPDPAAARQFYGALLGWQFPVKASPAVDCGVLGPIAAVRTGGCEMAALVGSTPALRARLPRPSWLPSIHVQSLDESLASAWALGGTVLLGEEVVAGLGRLALIRDPTGATLALLESVGSARP